MDRLEKLATWHQVSAARYLGPVRFRSLWEKLGENVGRAFDLPNDELRSLGKFMTTQAIEGLRDQADKWAESKRFMEDQLRREECCSEGRIVTLDDPLYPEYLRRSKMCHAIIYCRGRTEQFRAFDSSVGIVGTRQAAPESIQVAKTTAMEVAREGGIVVSGLAQGIDAAAHRGALLGGGLTIAVLGAGPDVVYPRDSKELYEEIVTKGLILSEYGFGQRVSQMRLRKRNKTTVALTNVLFLVESKASGGAMIAVQACKEQKKHVVTMRLPWALDDGGNAKAIERGAIDVAASSGVIVPHSDNALSPTRVAELVRRSIHKLVSAPGEH